MGEESSGDARREEMNEGGKLGARKKETNERGKLGDMWGIAIARI
jgi:hypothetical protein